MNEKRKIVLAGCGFAGMSTAYSFLNIGGIDKLVLIDANQEKAVGEAMDLRHGLPYVRGKMSIKVGGYKECRDVAVVVITTGVTQRLTEARLDLTARDTVTMKSVTEQITANSFDDILVTTSNPMDTMTCVTQKVSGLPTEHVIGSGMILDTVRLRYMMSECLDISTGNIHAYIMDEHGDSSFVLRTNACVGCKNLLDLLDREGRGLSDLHDIYTNVQQTGYEIVKRKRSTYYGIELSPSRLVHAIPDDENVILTVFVYQNNEYGQGGLCIGIPAVVNRQGICEIVRLDLNEMDQVKFNRSCETIHDINTDAADPLLQKTNNALPVRCAEDGKPGVPAYRDWFFLDCG